MEERREHERYVIELPAKIAVVTSEGESILEAFTANICARGALFDTEETIPVGTPVIVDLKVGNKNLRELAGANALITVTGKVARSDSTGTVITFDKNYQVRRL